MKTGEGGLISPSWGHIAAGVSTVTQTSLGSLLIAMEFAKPLRLALGFCSGRRVCAGREGF